VVIYEKSSPADVADVYLSMIKVIIENMSCDPAKAGFVLKALMDNQNDLFEHFNVRTRAFTLNILREKTKVL